MQREESQSREHSSAVRRRRARLIVAAALAIAAGAVTGQGSRSVWDGAYTAEQAESGRQAYRSNCADCHGPALEGGEEPGLKGDEFWRGWREDSVFSLFDFVRYNMPNDDPGTLSDRTVLDIVAYILSGNDLPAGDARLTVDSSLETMIYAEDGPGLLPSSTLVQITGCLEPESSEGWIVSSASQPSRVRDSAAGSAEAPPLGTGRFALRFALTPLAPLVGSRLHVTGLLMGDGGADGINVVTVESMAATCGE